MNANSSGLSLEEMKRAVSRNEALITVHYACESFMTAKDHPASIACIAMYDLQDNETYAFSRVDAPEGVDEKERGNSPVGAFL